MKPKVIVFNGAPKSGKDTFADAIEWDKDLMDSEYFVERYEMKSMLIKLTLIFYQIDHKEWSTRYDYRSLKEEPWDKLGGLSQREALIDMSENKIKPAFGKDFLGKTAAEQFEMDENDIYVFSDGGFMEELEPIIKKVGMENVLVIRLHRDGYTFEGDSRGFIEDKWFPFIEMVDVESKEIDETYGRIKKIVEKWLN
jgi:hypothetical protein